MPWLSSIVSRHASQSCDDGATAPGAAILQSSPGIRIDRYRVPRPRRPSYCGTAPGRAPTQFGGFRGSRIVNVVPVVGDDSTAIVPSVAAHDLANDEEAESETGIGRPIWVEPFLEAYVPTVRRASATHSPRNWPAEVDNRQHHGIGFDLVR